MTGGKMAIAEVVEVKDEWAWDAGYCISHYRSAFPFLSEVLDPAGKMNTDILKLQSEAFGVQEKTMHVNC